METNLKNILSQQNAKPIKNILNTAKFMKRTKFEQWK